MPTNLIAELKPWSHQVDGITLTCLEHRASADDQPGRPILHFIHGNGFCGLSYMPLLQTMAPDYDLFLNEHQHGLADHPPFDGWNATAKRCLSVLLTRRNNWPDVPLIGMGHSFGAVMTLLMAVERPDLFDAIILLDPIIFRRRMLPFMSIGERFGLLERIPIAVQAKKRRASWSSREAALQYFRGRGVFKGWTEEALISHVDHSLACDAQGGMTLRCPPWLEAAVFSTWPRKLWSSIRAIQCPTLLLYGCDTFPFVIHSAHKAAKINRNIEIDALSGQHCFMQEVPEETGERIRHFLNATTSSRNKEGV